MAVYGTELQFVAPASSTFEDEFDALLESFNGSTGYYSIDAMIGEGILSILVGVTLDPDGDLAVFSEKVHAVVSALGDIGVDTSTLKVIQSQREFVLA